MPEEPTTPDAADEHGQALQRLQQLQMMLARAREEIRDLENELHRQEGRVEALASKLP